MEHVRSAYGRSGKNGVGVVSTACTCEVDLLASGKRDFAIIGLEPVP